MSAVTATIKVSLVKQEGELSHLQYEADNLTDKKIKKIFTPERAYYLLRALDISNIGKFTFTASLTNFTRTKVTKVCLAVSKFWETKHQIKVFDAIKAEALPRIAAEAKETSWFEVDMQEELAKEYNAKLEEAAQKLTVAKTETGISVTWE